MASPTTEQKRTPQPRSNRDERLLLADGEIFWRDRHDWLLKAGKAIISCEDGVPLIPTTVIDATRAADGEVVVIKRIQKSYHQYESAIGRYLTSPPLSDDPRNRCCPILDVLQDPLNDDFELLVMPLLRRYNDPKFETVGEAIEFFRQALEGLQFMHEHHVAHRDCMTLNIMMDPKPILPDLFHFSLSRKTRDYKGYIKPSTRTAHPVRYYWTDFGLSRRYNSDDTNPLEVPIFGGDKSVPEFNKDPHSPCNPFRTDVYYVGNLIREDFLQVYKNLGFMEPLVTRMVQDAPEKRPTMDEVVTKFKEITSKLDPSHILTHRSSHDRSSTSTSYSCPEL
ncbi:hypothetical protein C8Q80DRAFT_1272620 [Daedaleopsis nitida]|nr:hypothetical protein C8Q80DRAFT_1272620 [Daedaleopsis nitida]